ncbi:MAG: hypothetical protein KBC57_00065 [Neisseriaceae bacterium]|nr:hypothetical protein [Neisseriaceae bacterium]MBP6860733.1 hypothetical protein [Neisseriaceae bacterium]
MNQKLGLILIGIVSSLMANLASAVAVNNDYIFIENEVDEEYFITPRKTDPRFSGANVFTKYARENQQLSLGYMGYTIVASINSNLDIWLENSPINGPFIGNRCWRSASACPNDSVVKPQFTDRNGAYKMRIATHAGEGGYIRGIFSDSFYEYMKQRPTNSTEVLTYKFCYTTNDYDPSKGERCETSTGSHRPRVNDHVFTVKKNGHIKLKSTNALQEIFVDSNGNATVGLGSEFCRNGFINSESGIMCQMVAFEMSGTVFPTMNLRMEVATDKLGFTPAAANIRYRSDDGRWYNYSATTTASNVFAPGRSDITVFFSQTFLKNLIARGVDLTNSQEFFTFAFRNSAVPQSGFYEFSPSNTILLRPRNYGISIVDKDFVQHPTRTGKVGNTEPPIEFEYIVSTSGPRQANEITAQVTGPTHRTSGGQNYCLFSSPDNKIQVPFSAFLSYVDASGRTVKERNSCGDAPMDILPARWEETPWSNAPQEGSFYRTNLKLTFPMNERQSLYSITGEDWMGVVRAQGEVRVKATWRGNDVLP